MLVIVDRITGSDPITWLGGVKGRGHMTLRETGSLEVKIEVIIEEKIKHRPRYVIIWRVISTNLSLRLLFIICLLPSSLAGDHNGQSLDSEEIQVHLRTNLTSNK